MKLFRNWIVISIFSISCLLIMGSCSSSRYSTAAYRKYAKKTKSFSSRSYRNSSYYKKAKKKSIPISRNYVIKNKRKKHHYFQ